MQQETGKTSSITGIAFPNIMDGKDTKRLKDVRL
jgi:hypothetical protein